MACTHSFHWCCTCSRETWLVYQMHYFIVLGRDLRASCYNLTKFYLERKKKGKRGEWTLSLLKINFLIFTIMHPIHPISGCCMKSSFLDLLAPADTYVSYLHCTMFLLGLPSFSETWSFFPKCTYISENHLWTNDPFLWIDKRRKHNSNQKNGSLSNMQMIRRYKLYCFLAICT